MRRKQIGCILFVADRREREKKNKLGVPLVGTAFCDVQRKKKKKRQKGKRAQYK